MHPTFIQFVNFRLSFLPGSELYSQFILTALGDGSYATQFNENGFLCTRACVKIISYHYESFYQYLMVAIPQVYGSHTNALRTLGELVNKIVHQANLSASSCIIVLAMIIELYVRIRGDLAITTPIINRLQGSVLYHKCSIPDFFINGAVSFDRVQELVQLLKSCLENSRSLIVRDSSLMIVFYTPPGFSEHNYREYCNFLETTTTEE